MCQKDKNLPSLCVYNEGSCWDFNCLSACVCLLLCVFVPVSLYAFARTDRVGISCSAWLSLHRRCTAISHKGDVFKAQKDSVNQPRYLECCSSLLAGTQSHLGECVSTEDIFIWLRHISRVFYMGGHTLLSAAVVEMIKQILSSKDKGKVSKVWITITILKDTCAVGFLLCLSKSYFILSLPHNNVNQRF